MVVRILSFCVILVVCKALSVDIFGGYANVGRNEMENESNATASLSEFITSSVNEIETYISGFVRNDTIRVLENKWVQAQVVPIGLCFREGDTGRSAKIEQITMNASHILSITNIFNEMDCSGTHVSLSYIFPMAKESNNSLSLLTHVPDLATALETDPASNGAIIISSHFSSQGCEGVIAQYNLFPMHQKETDVSVGQELYQCDATAEIVVRKHRVGGSCAVKQSFQCTDTCEEGKPFPYYQTARCVYSTHAAPQPMVVDDDANDDWLTC